MLKIIKHLAFIVVILPLIYVIIISQCDTQAQTTDDYMYYKGSAFVSDTTKPDLPTATDTLTFPKPVNGKQILMLCYQDNEYVQICYYVKLEDFVECIDDTKIKPRRPETMPHHPKIDKFGHPIPED